MAGKPVYQSRSARMIFTVTQLLTRLARWFDRKHRQKSADEAGAIIWASRKADEADANPPKYLDAAADAAFRRHLGVDQ